MEDKIFKSDVGGRAGSVQHWLYGEIKYNVLVEKDTLCKKCIHNEVCDHNMDKRCSNFRWGDSTYNGCGGCEHRFPKYDQRQPIPCFHCKWFKEK